MFALVASVAVGGTNLAAPIHAVLDASIFNALRSDAPVRTEPLEIILPNGEAATGWYGRPDGQPQTLVVLCHPFGSAAADFRPFMEDLAARGIASVAMDYRGAVGSFNVEDGAEDTRAATLFVLSSQPTINRTMIYGFSMGGAVAGLTIASMPMGTFDVWVSGSGVADLASTWNDSPPLRIPIEDETGGKPSAVANEYRERSPLQHVETLAARKVGKIVLVHGIGDPVVSFAQAEELFEGLRERKAPVTLVAVGGSRPPWGCSSLDPTCLADPMALVGSHGVGHFAFVAPLILALVEGTWQPSEGERVTIDGDAGIVQALV